MKFRTWQQGGRGGSGLPWSVGAQLATQLSSAATVGDNLDRRDVRAKKKATPLRRVRWMNDTLTPNLHVRGGPSSIAVCYIGHLKNQIDLTYTRMLEMTDSVLIANIKQSI